LLYEHIQLVNTYASQLVIAHGLDTTIDQLIIEYTKDWKNEEAAGFLKTLLVHAIVFHDFGKVNENFQVKRMKHKGFRTMQNNALSPSHGHSYLGTFIFLSYHINILLKSSFSQEERVKLIGHGFFFAYTILQHHSPALYDIIQRDGLFTRFKEVLAELKKYLLLYQLDNIDEKMLSNIYANIESLWYGAVAGKLPNVPFPLFALIKLNFSLLTASDYLATHEYMNGNDTSSAKTDDFGIFDSRERIEEIAQHLRSYKHNVDVYKDLETHQLDFPSDRTNANLNFLRKQMAVETVRNIRENYIKRLFYLEAPTGGGKTNLSALTVAELLLTNPELNKVFYVFPFTTLITQTFASLKESMGLKDDEIVELHSKAPFASKQDKKDKEDTKDGLYGDEKKDFIDNLFALYPLTLMSHVKFFDILKTNSKEQNYLLHRLANSIVVIDELQSYNPGIWDKMLFFIEKYAHYFNIRFVLMSATLPKISNLKVGFTDMVPFVDLLPNAQQYMTNVNFSSRVSFNFELYHQDKIDLETLARAVQEKSRAYAEQNGSVKTIVEFIYKKSASAFQRLFQQNDFFDKVFVLSGTILESRRREIINYIKRNTSDQINILLITTQVVEAGVDIDMDLGFKNISLLDSDEQLAGRVNRNAAKNCCEVYLFHIDDARVLYGKDHRYKKTNEMSIGERQEVLQTKDFKRLYEKVLLSIDDSNNPLFKNSISGYKELVSELRYTDVDKEFQIIEQDNKTVFVPLFIPVYVEGAETGKNDAIFTSDDLAFLERYGITPVEHEFDNGMTLAINGESVWELYTAQIEQQIINRKNNNGFDIAQKMNFKTLQAIMSKFCFSLISYSKDYGEIQLFGKEEYGYFYFSYFNDNREKGKLYDYTTGLNSEAFSDSYFI